MHASGSVTSATTPVRLAPGRPDLRRHAVGGIGGAIDDHQACARRGQLERGGAPQPRATTGHDAGPSGEPGEVAHPKNSPPFTSSDWPVIIRDMPDAKNTIDSAMSSCGGISPSGISAVISAITSSAVIPRDCICQST